MSAAELNRAAEALRIRSHYEGPGLSPRVFEALADVLDLAAITAGFGELDRELGGTTHAQVPDQFMTLARLIIEDSAP